MKRTEANQKTNFRQLHVRQERVTAIKAIISQTEETNGKTVFLSAHFCNCVNNSICKISFCSLRLFQNSFNGVERNLEAQTHGRAASRPGTNWVMWTLGCFKINQKKCLCSSFAWLFDGRPLKTALPVPVALWAERSVPAPPLIQVERAEH